MKICIDLKTSLSVIRKAFDNKELEMFTNPGGCTYSGPCVIGVLFDEHTRRYLDVLPNYTLRDLVELGIISVPIEQLCDFSQLQIIHDSCLLNNHIEIFEKCLRRLEDKYLTAE